MPPVASPQTKAQSLKAHIPLLLLPAALASMTDVTHQLGNISMQKIRMRPDLAPLARLTFRSLQNSGKTLRV